ncbi:MAG: DEAD/DEAH box helicase family protein [Gemmatimonadota bacterium]|nr:DEAD/DEAH box helicase family protein [Gemmatimonadota bacterium]
MKKEYDFSKAERGKFYSPGDKLNLPRVGELTTTSDSEAPLDIFITQETQNTLEAYREQPRLVTEHANLEHDTAHGGYAHRQLFELIQNSADALFNQTHGRSILVRLVGNYLYCADDGKPIDDRGVEALMFSHMSPKRNTGEIGRFGLGFKSVLGITDAPEFYSRRGSFRFDREYAAKRISEFVKAERYPVLRLPIPTNVQQVMKEDEDLQEMMMWATNIVRLPLKTGAQRDIAKQIEGFPPEFLLFVDHVQYLTLEDGEHSREFVLEQNNGEIRLDTGETTSRWKCFKTTHSLSREAQLDRRSLDDSNNVPIWWAAPLDDLSYPGYFWHFFPTQTRSLLAGILNAPWKTNEDRQNLLPGPYNDELIDAAARLVGEHLTDLATEQDPARHLDALPHRHEAGDLPQSDRLRDEIYATLRNRSIVPDQKGCMRKIQELLFAPEELTQSSLKEQPLMMWECYESRPIDWLHHSALTRNRLARVNQLFPKEPWASQETPRASIAEWLEALVGCVNTDDTENAVLASGTALQIAASIPDHIRAMEQLGNIVLTQSLDWCEPNPLTVFLLAPSEDNYPVDEKLVHPELTSDENTANALSKLGIKHLSSERRFLSIVQVLLTSHAALDDSSWDKFWSTSRSLPSAEKAFEVILKYGDGSVQSPKIGQIRVRTHSGHWRPIDSVILSDCVMIDDNEDSGVMVDQNYHDADYDLLRKLGVVDRPQSDRDLSREQSESWYKEYLRHCRRGFTARDLPSSPRWGYLCFKSTVGSGPLSVLTLLSDRANARYTWDLLALESTYAEWTMRHETQGIYPEFVCPNPAIEMLRKYGRIQYGNEYIPFQDVLGPEPDNSAVLHILLSHPMADRIKKAFDLSEPVLEPMGEDDPIPLLDAWPGLESHLSEDLWHCNLIRCEHLVAENGSHSKVDCVRINSSVYLVGSGNEKRDLSVVSHELGIELKNSQLDEVLCYVAPQEIDAQRAAIRKLASDAERLAMAVGEDALRSGLPASLLAVLEAERPQLTSVELAEAAIATYHTGALREYRRALDHLAPPVRWAGSPRAVEFVRSLGFNAEWAGQRGVRRPSYLEVDGPSSLPPLHRYQRIIADKTRELLCGDHTANGHRRGMISLPTGSGKTRIAVEAIVEALGNSFDGSILWIADRDELCEQAVEAWRQVWSSEGVEGKRLRVYRMWGDQPSPVVNSDYNVIVATIQTLNARLSTESREYRFLSDVNLIVFDEAHRSVAPTYTTVMQELGLTRWKKAEEPFLIGLTATPYRGHDEAETARLASRYGHNRLDAGVFASNEPSQVVNELQDMRVLAHASHETIEGGDFRLNSDELGKMMAMAFPAWLPQSMEDRIAGDVERTKRIIDAYMRFVYEVNRDWPTLVFATSVEHAKTVAALLSSAGVTSRAVSGTTETAIRRSVVEEFRTGKVNVLVNYGVFREGFDAPKTRVIIVARPVYSPNLYFQMIGRGLRGPKNGGNDECLIINTLDNIENFNKELAFSDLDWLWS